MLCGGRQSVGKREAKCPVIHCNSGFAESHRLVEGVILYFLCARGEEVVACAWRSAARAPPRSTPRYPDLSHSGTADCVVKVMGVALLRPQRRGPHQAETARVRRDGPRVSCEFSHRRAHHLQLDVATNPPNMQRFLFTKGSMTRDSTSA